jgi:hypothetical protein
LRPYTRDSEFVGRHAADRIVREEGDRADD